MNNIEPIFKELKTRKLVISSHDFSDKMLGMSWNYYNVAKHDVSLEVLTRLLHQLYRLRQIDLMAYVQLLITKDIENHTPLKKPRIKA
jgi:hypothetical protein